eukprot:gene1531-1670_t
MAELMKCNTCFAAFPSLELIKEHYRTDWHCLNAKRRGQGLPPLKRDQFLAYQATAPKKTKQAAKPATSTTTAQPASKPRQDGKSSPVKTSSSATEKAQEDANEGEEVEMEEEENEEEDEDEDEERKPMKQQPIGDCISIFDDKELYSPESAVQYMAEKFGFFVPDVEYLTDLPGLLTYLNEKNHMISKSHCKIAYDNDVDGDEYDDFYDFSSTYEDLEDANSDGVEEMEVTHTGELQLPDGRVLGHRQFRLYYKQYYRPTDNRAPVLAQQREELLRLGCKFGGSEWQVSEINSMSDTDVMTNIIRYQKEIRKGQLVEQRGIKRKERMDQRRLYNRTVDQLRSSENTTAKIRDYHRMLV